MKKLLVLFLVLASVQCVNADMLRNGDFDYATQYGHWSHSTWGSWYDYDLTDGTSIVSFGWWGNLGIWQEVGKAELGGPITEYTYFQPNTVYTLSVVTRDAGCNGITLQMGGDWAAMVSQNYTFSSPGTSSVPGAWETKVLTIDTGVRTDLVGQAIKVSVKSDNTNGGNDWTQIDSVTLVPEPTTMAILGLGALLGLRRKNA